MSQPLAVCMFDNERVRGGAEEHMLCLLRRLDRRRFRPLLCCPQELLRLLCADLPRDVNVLPLALRSHLQFGEMKQLSRFLRVQNVQILHSHGFRPSLVASPVGRWARVPVTLETTHIREYWRKGWKSNYAMDRFASRWVDHYIAVSEANRNYLVHEKGLPDAKVTTILNGCEMPAAFSVSPHAEFKQQAGFAAEDPLLLMVGRLEPQKGHAVLLRALAELKREWPRLRLVALGEGSLRAELKSQVRALGLEDSVAMPGHSRQVREWMMTADVCVLPSFAEGLPLVAIECLALGRPMVATAVDGTPEIVVNGKTGLTIPAGDSEALARAIARLLREPQLGAQLGTHGAAWVRARFTLERQVHETEALYARLWQQKTGFALGSEAQPVAEAAAR